MAKLLHDCYRGFPPGCSFGSGKKKSLRRLAWDIVTKVKYSFAFICTERGQIKPPPSILARNGPSYPRTLHCSVPVRTQRPTQRRLSLTPCFHGLVGHTIPCYTPRNGPLKRAKQLSNMNHEPNGPCSKAIIDATI